MLVCEPTRLCDGDAEKTEKVLQIGCDISDFSELTCLLSICLVLMCFVLVVSRVWYCRVSKKSCLAVCSSRILYPEQAKMTGKIFSDSRSSLRQGKYASHAMVL